MNEGVYVQNIIYNRLEETSGRLLQRGSVNKPIRIRIPGIAFNISNSSTEFLTFSYKSEYLVCSETR